MNTHFEYYCRQINKSPKTLPIHIQYKLYIKQKLSMSMNQKTSNRRSAIAFAKRGKALHPTRVHHHHPYKHPHVRKVIESIQGVSISNSDRLKSTRIFNASKLYHSKDEDGEESSSDSSLLLQNLSLGVSNNNSPSFGEPSSSNSYCNSSLKSEMSLELVETDSLWSSPSPSLFSLHNTSHYSVKDEKKARHRKGIHHSSNILVDITTESMKIYFFQCKLIRNVELLPFCASYLSMKIQNCRKPGSIFPNLRCDKESLDIQQLGSEHLPFCNSSTDQFILKLLRFLSYSTMVDERCFLIACMYIHDALNGPEFELTNDNLVYIFCTCLMLSSKFNEDEYMQNLAWCQVMPIFELRKCQRMMDLSLQSAAKAVDTAYQFQRMNLKSSNIQEQRFSYSLKTLNIHEIWILKVLNYKLLKSEKDVHNFVTAHLYCLPY